MVAQAFNHSTQEIEAGKSLCVQGQPGLHSESSRPKIHSETLSQKKSKKYFKITTIIVRNDFCALSPSLHWSQKTRWGWSHSEMSLHFLV